MGTKRLSEKDFMRQVVQLARLLGYEVYHTRDSRGSAAGFPDLVMAKPGRPTLFRELKTDAGKLTADQERWLAVLSAAGSDARCWRPADWPAIEATLKGES